MRFLAPRHFSRNFWFQIHYSSAFGVHLSPRFLAHVTFIPVLFVASSDFFLRTFMRTFLPAYFYAAVISISAGAYPGFCTMKGLGIFLLPPR